MTDQQPTAPQQQFPTMPGETVRDRLVGALRIDLLGPETENETLHQSPATRYLVGMLAPQGTSVDASEDDQSGADAEDDEDLDTGVAVGQSLVSSSIGLSFIVPLATESITVTTSWGEYAKVEREARETDDLPTDVDPDADPEEFASRSPRRRAHDWVRTSFRQPLTISFGIPPFSAKLTDGAQLEWLQEPSGDRRVVSVFLVNNRKAPADGRPPDELWMYQPRIVVNAGPGGILPRDAGKTVPDADPDTATADLVYRNRQEFAVGHGVATSWVSAPHDAHLAREIATEIIPDRRVHGTRGPKRVAPISMDALAAATTGRALTTLLEPLLREYESWIEDREHELADVPEPHARVASDHASLQRHSLQRMWNGLHTLETDADALDAFRFANKAMALQRRRSVSVRLGRRSESIPAEIEAYWRPFQIGFMLQALSGITHPEDDERELADLLWYPTGGGKTEAYLGLTAFTLALRRIRASQGDASYAAGTAVLMRYTLRLLTIQQFQRALTLMCACEVIRKRDTNRWGNEPFSIGLWVGMSITPNSFEDSRKAIDTLATRRHAFGASPVQILYCPWCGSDLTHKDYMADADRERTLIYCRNKECDFAGSRSELGLPALVVDEEIYRHPPSLLLATVDKFAMMAWNGRVKALFGHVNRFCSRHGFLTDGDDHAKNHRATGALPQETVTDLAQRLAPPDLIIQDELHLISGPLGSLVGIYESAVEWLCLRKVGDRTIRPKVVASTATVRRARSQLRALFDRDVEIFPAPGIDAATSFFAEEDDDPGRLYVGVFGPGKSIKTILVRTYAALLSRAQYEFDRLPPTDPERGAADSYMTLVGYFNSLRELGGAVRLLADDVPARLRVLQRRGFAPNRVLYEKDRELTSRRSSAEIGETLKRLDRTFGPRISGEYPIDVLLASNMISVGVDIDRLGMMVVSAQPKTSAEYIQATSRVGRAFPGLIVEVFNWIRPRDISHYERFEHYHNTFYRHVEATSVTPFSERARDRALRGVLTSFVRQSIPGMAGPESAANGFAADSPDVETIAKALAARAERISERDGTAAETAEYLRILRDEWRRLVDGAPQVVYSPQGIGGKGASPKTVLLRRMEDVRGPGIWPVAQSLREVESEIDVVLLDEGS